MTGRGRVVDFFGVDVMGLGGASPRQVEFWGLPTRLANDCVLAES